MLKRLELIGFKSFADKTAFDFAAGITAVVGPNGSGKSNVVDAVKWVLGEQSAKSLRGGAMADVIFNGSTSRKSLGLAEVSLVFDNAKAILATQGAEVRITRRVYRDGQGEYLINGQLCRLKDVKDLFLGTGAGAGAYSIIEQGRVDALLQASVEDRRAIFEEAAGISRFKVKKIECLRRLERVGQNLTRLQDILGQVDQQLKSVRLHAAKAERHREYSARLQELRLGLGLREYQTLTTDLERAEGELAGLRTALDATAGRTSEEALQTKRIETELAAIENQTRACEQTQAENSARITVLNSAVDRDQAQAAELQSELTRGRNRQCELVRQVQALEAAGVTAENELANARGQRDDEEFRSQASAEQIQTLLAANEAIRRQIESDQSEHFELLRAAARWQNESVSAKAMIEQLRRERDRLSARSVHAVDTLVSIDLELTGLNTADVELQDRLIAAKQALIERQKDRDRARESAEGLKRDVADLRARASGLCSRVEVLEGFERSQEGLGSGIREVFTWLNDSESDSPERGAIVGLVADFLSAPRHIAPLIELALGTVAQCFLVRDVGQLYLALAEQSQPFSGRVSFLPLHEPTAELKQVPEGFDAIRAAELVRCDRPELAALPRQLLGSTLLVRDLKTAREIAEICPGWRQVTPAGEVLEADGTLTVGTHHAEVGLLSRKSELRELKQLAAETGERIDALEFDLEWAEERAFACEAQIDGLRQEIEVLTEQQADLRARIGRHHERRAGLRGEVALSQDEVGGLDAEISRHEARCIEADAHASSAERSAQILQRRQTELEQSIRRSDQVRIAAEQFQSVAQIELAKFHERIAGLQNSLVNVSREAKERRLEADELGRRLAEIADRLVRCQVGELNASAELNEVISARELADRGLAELSTRRDALRSEAQRLRDAAQSAQGAWQKQNDELHARELTASGLRHRRETLTSRLAEDYQIDLDTAFAMDQSAGGPAAELGGLPDADARAEIDDLRKKLARLGSVSLDALDELAQIELKAQALQTQFDDLTQARASLEEIIHKINNDSKKLFAEAFAAIREHFQELFRRLFGGGMADVVLDKPDDPLESGIEIVARPPGKELRSIALMSGGERTLTAVALLLAIFRSKPSPFCILDEVDAALDEANTARLTTVLREFAGESQFIVITHAKRTMAAADMLYGVTMQESGISKRVAVRFEEWPDEQRQAA